MAAYVEPPLTLPPDLGPWRVEPVEAGWERRWREYHHGVVVAGRLWVGPPWERSEDGVLPVVIDPGQAFGTGAHATTAACLELLCDEPPTRLLDVGCGSGVLAIAAAKLGFKPVFARDNDPLAVAATRRNAEANGVELDVAQADAVTDPLPAAPLWVANILHGPLSDIFTRPDVPPRAIVSGLLAEEEFTPPGYRVVRRLERREWQALVLER